MNAMLALLCAVAAPFLEVRQFPAHSAEAHYFMAPLASGAAPALFCLDGRQLYVYSHDDQDAARQFTLPEGTTAVDAFDLNGDGAVEIIAIAGNRVMRLVVAHGTGAGEPQELFRAPSQFSTLQSAPFLHVLGVLWEEKRVLAIPGENDFTLYSARGEIAASWGMGADAFPQTVFGRPFSATVATAPSIGPPGAMELRIRRDMAIEPALPDALPVALPAILGKTTVSAPYASVSVSGYVDYLYWPAFRLATADNTPGMPEEFRNAQMLHAADLTRGPATVARLHTPGRSGDARGFRIEPELRYPGLRIGGEYPAPDFNRDGFADLILWRDTAGAPIAGGWSKALVRGQRTTRIAVHLFDPKRRRFAPEPDSHFPVDLPASWISGRSNPPPLRHVLLADINGDGATDFAMATAGAEYAVWLYSETGFAEAPDWRHTFSAPLEEMVFHGNIGRQGEGFVLRTRDHVYTVLPPAAAATESGGR